MASSAGFITGVLVSQVVTGFLLASSTGLVSGGIALKLWEIMAVGHLASTTLTLVVSLLAPDDFAFEDIAQEGSEMLADGGARVDQGDENGTEGSDRR
jgi:hypothetical protein